MRRRALLATVAAAVPATAGCLGAFESTGGNDTASTTERPPTSSPTATCTVDDSLDLADVDVPEDPTEGPAREVAEFVERAYARDRAEAEGWNVSGVEYVHSETDDDADAGVVVFVEVSLDAAESAERAGDAETTLLASLHYDAWYRVTEARVERSAADSDDPPDYGWVTIACA
ncbi:hypothetical protein [Halorubellus salinus]|uniref:hypothetical protein n=1 Tax=Halorubellus salinus TaxID=755309 RepID=UPI001D06C90B|nr:hypothetical protein [Halorubellus salinus]